MGEFLAREFILTLQDLDRLRLLSERLEEQTQRIKAGLEITATAESIERTKRDLEERLTELAGHCESLGLRSTLTYIGWMRRHLDKPSEDLGAELGFDLQIPHGLDKARGMIPE